jgi:hypothetical protein
MEQQIEKVLYPVNAEMVNNIAESNIAGSNYNLLLSLLAEYPPHFESHV